MKKKRIALINPPSPFLIKERVFPNLGILDVATSLINNGEEVLVIDLCGATNPKKQIEQIANNFDIFGFSSTTPQFVETYKLFKTLKKINSQAKTIIGGAHPSAMYSVLQAGNTDDPNISPLEEFDHIIVGEGESLNLNNLREKWIVMPVIKNLNSLQIPDRSLIDITSYKYFLNGKSTTTIMTQRGCPFKCSFCCGREVDMYRKVRTKSPEKIIQELDYLNDNFGFEAFMWFDDEININPSRLLPLSKRLAKRNYIHRGFVRSDLLVKNPQTLDALVDAGFVELCFGVESGSDKILKRVNKRTTSEINSQAVKMIKEKGIRCKIFTIIGHPRETYKDVENTVQWIKDNKPDSFDFTLLTPYPGSILYDKSTSSSKHPGFDREWKGLFFKRINYSFTESHYKGKPGGYSCHSRTNNLTSKELLKLQEEKEAELRSFFST